MFCLDEKLYVREGWRYLFSVIFVRMIVREDSKNVFVFVIYFILSLLVLNYLRLWSKFKYRLNDSYSYKFLLILVLFKFFLLRLIVICLFVNKIFKF